MNPKQEETAISIIAFLKTRGSANKKDIAKAVGKKDHDDNFENILDSLKNDYRLIRNIKPDAYMLTRKGSDFESFEKLEEEYSLQVRLAKSNIEANELQKTIALKNDKNEKLNRKLMWTTIIVGSVTVILTIVNILLLVFQD